jgi:hypothetical protein
LERLTGNVARMEKRGLVGKRMERDYSEKLRRRREDNIKM